jgi:hypothetical protein
MHAETNMGTGVFAVTYKRSVGNFTSIYLAIYAAVVAFVAAIHGEQGFAEVTGLNIQSAVVFVYQVNCFGIVDEYHGACTAT